VTVAVVTDSAAALPADLVARHGVTVVPMWLTVRGVPELEGTRALEELVREESVTTSAPTPGEFEQAIKDRLRSSDGVLVLTIAGSMSATYDAARLAGEAVGGPVRVLDDVEAAARQVVERVRLVAAVPTLDHLVRSGRVPGLAGWAANRLGVNPLFEFRGGKVRRLRPALSREAALDRMVSLVDRSRVPGAPLHIAALHALAVETAQELLDRVRASFQPAASFIGEFGPVMVVHTGPGLAGLAWWWDDRAAR